MLALQISMFGIPPTIIVLSIITLVTEGMQVSQMLFLLLQVGTLAWFGLDLYPALKHYHEECLNSQKIVSKIQNYALEKFGSALVER